MKTAFAVLLIACVLGAFFGSKATLQPHGGLQIDEEYLDFGDVLEQKDYELILPIRNRSLQPITILDIETSCHCTVVELKSLTIKPGKSSQLRLRIDLTATEPIAEEVNSKDLAEDFTVSLRPVLQSRQPVAAWSVHGRVRKYISLSQRRIDFQELLDSTAPYEGKVVVVSTHFPIESLVTAFTGKGLAVQVSEDPNSKSYLLNIIPSSELEVGSFSQQLIVTPLTSDSARAAPASTVYITGRVTSDIQILPASLSFGRVPLGTTVTESVTFSSKSGTPIAISLKPPESIIVDEADLNSFASSHIVRVSFTSKENGHHTFAIPLLVSRGNGEPATAMKLRVSYTGAR